MKRKASGQQGESFQEVPCLSELSNELGGGQKEETYQLLLEERKEGLTCSFERLGAS